MKENSPLKKNASKILLIALAVLGFGIAMLTYRYMIFVTTPHA
jgi:hypothetical protein